MSVPEKVLDKLAKLFRLSQSANEHEAALAAQRAAEIMAEHHLDEATVRAASQDDKSREPVLNEIIDSLPNRKSWKGILANGVAAGFGCRMYWSRGGGKIDLHLVGRKSDIEATRYTLAWLLLEVDRLAEAAWVQNVLLRGGGQATSFKNSFKLGAVSVIFSRMKDRRRQAIDEAASKRVDASQALVLVRRDAAEVDIFYQKLGPMRSAGRARLSSAAAYHQGREAGARVHLDGGPGLPSPAAKLRGGS